MKPGDHPEFFRFPAPEGRSRESTIVLDERGRFWHDGQQVEKPAMARAFAGWIRRHPDNGRFILENGYDWTYFEVKDVPFFIHHLSVSEDAQGRPERAILTLSDGTSEELNPATLQMGAHDAVYCRVKDAEFEARFNPQAQTALSPLLVEADGGRQAVRLKFEEFPLGSRS